MINLLAAIAGLLIYAINRIKKEKANLGNQYQQPMQKQTQQSIKQNNQNTNM